MSEVRIYDPALGDFRPASTKDFSMGYDAQDDMVKIKSMQKKFRDSFVGSAVDPTKFETTLGAGGTISVSGGQLTMSSGTTAGDETIITSVDTFTVPFRVQFHLQLSQRIANQDFIVEAVSVDPQTLQPNDVNSLGWRFSGVTATQAIYFVQNGGQAALDSAASTIPTTVSGSIYEIEPFADESWFHGGLCWTRPTADRTPIAGTSRSRTPTRSTSCASAGRTGRLPRRPTPTPSCSSSRARITPS